jgi:putative peptidoglycan lipid II flippase
MTNSILSIVIMAMGGLCLLLSFGAPYLVPVIAPGFSGEKLALTIMLTRVMMLSPFFFALSAVFSSVLNSFRQFVAVSIAPLSYNASIIFGIAVLSKPFGIMGVAYGAILGAILHLSIQLPPVIALGWRAHFNPDTKQEGVREVGRLFLPRVFGIDISQVSLFVGTSIGTTFSVGAPAIFNLALNIAFVPIGSIAIPFAIAAFPNLSEAIARGDRESFTRTFASTFRQILFFLFPLSALAVILRVHILRVIIGSQGLSWGETRLTAAALGLLVLSTTLQGLTPLLARAFYAFKNTWIPVVISAVAMTLEIVLIYALKSWLASGPGASTAWLWLGLFGVDDVRVLALPLAFSIASLVQVILLLFLLRQKFGRIGGAGIVRSFGKFVLGSLATAWVASMIVAPGLASLDHRSFASVFMEAAQASLAGFAAYFLVLWILKSEELRSVAGALRKSFLKLEKPMAVNDTQEL